MTDNQMQQVATSEVGKSKSRLLRTIWRLLWPELLKIIKVVAEQYAEERVKKENEKLFGGDAARPGN